MKTSIIILSYNQVDYTLACIESIKENTREDYEIIVVDNNSSVETVSALESVDNIILIKNSQNRGFPGGCNDGIMAATGDNILLLNNDTIVTENWLTNLLAALYSSDKIGAVGPVSNSCSNFQSIPCSYGSLDEMFSFAKEYNKSNKDLWEKRNRLIGFALLIKKDVLDKVGLLDERFFPGNFEDDDLSLRIRLAGYDLVLCKDTFIHHFGSVSFTEESSNRFGKTLSINEKKFLDKWQLSHQDIFSQNLELPKNLRAKNYIGETVSFIYVTNDEKLFEKSCSYINKLFIPEGIQVEIVKITNEKSIFTAYNKGMAQAKGKYKVYLHQDTFIENPNFIYDLLFNFSYDKKLGMIGLAGAKRLPSSGIWWESKDTIGEVIESHTGKLELLKFREPAIPFEQVECIDGFLIATQYDLKWREDLFDGWHFYDISQSKEFINAGYKVGIPSQIRPWATHDCGIVNTKNGYEEARQIFLQNYSEPLPLVSVLIPTYNRPDYLEVAIQSAVNQTYKNLEIIVCDDGENPKTKEVVDKFPGVSYFKNEKNLGHTQNYKKCFDLAKGEFIAYLMDDDIFHPEKIHIMTSVFLDNEEHRISLVTSKRNLIGKDGELLPDSFNVPPVPQSTLMPGVQAADFMLKNIFNFIGEPTTPMFRKQDIQDIFEFEGREYKVCSDMATWLKLLAIGNLVYITDPLSSFRLHEDQGQKQQKNEVIGTIELAHQVLNARKFGFLKNKSDYSEALQRCIDRFDSIRVSHAELIANEFKEFREFYDQLLQQKQLV